MGKGDVDAQKKSSGCHQLFLKKIMTKIFLSNVRTDGRADRVCFPSLKRKYKNIIKIYDMTIIKLYDMTITKIHQRYEGCSKIPWTGPTTLKYSA